MIRLRVHQRLALAAYYRGRAAEALDEVAQGLRSARLLTAHRPACTLHSVAYATYYSVTGDVDAALRQANAMAPRSESGGENRAGRWRASRCTSWRPNAATT